MTGQSNPFLSDITNNPRKIGPSVASLNEKPLRIMLDAFKQLIKDPPPRQDAKLDHTLLLVSPEAGFGKSHLIGRLFQELKDSATQIYIIPFEDADSCWKSILDTIIHELKALEYDAAEKYAAHAPTQLHAFAHGVIAHLVADMLATDVLTTPAAIKKQQVIRALREGNMRTYKLASKNATWINFIRSQFQNLLGQMADHAESRGMRLRTNPRCWLKVFFTYAWSERHELRSSCLDWLKGDAINEDDAQSIGLSPADTPKADISTHALNALCKNRILDLCQLASFYRPFLFCFDQTENYCADHALINALGNCIQVLTDSCPNQMSVFTVNQTPWKKIFSANFSGAHLDRYTDPPIMLEEVTLDQTKELIQKRMELWASQDDHALRVLHDEGSIAAAYNEIKAIKGVRAVLKALRKITSSPPIPALEELFQKCCDRLTSQPHALEFNRDKLRWLVQDLAKGLPHSNIKRFDLHHGQPVAGWQSANGDILFDFESGNYWLRWVHIAKHAQSFHDNHAHAKVIYLRTPELAPVPPPGKWPKAGPQIEAVKKTCLHIIPLSLDQVIEIYAGYDLHSSAVQGDIEYSPAQVNAFLLERFKPIWDQFTQRTQTEEQPPAPTLPRNEYIKKVEKIVCKHRFLSLAELITELPANAPRDRAAVLAACGLIPAIAIRECGNTVILQWQTASPSAN